MRLENGDPWHFRADVGHQANFAVWLLMRDGLRVPPFDRHPDGDRTLRSAGLNAVRWWMLAIGEWEPRFPEPLEQRLEELGREYRPVFRARRMTLVPPHDPQLWRSLEPYRAVLAPFDLEIVDYPWPVVRALSPTKALVSATGRDAGAWRQRVLEAAEQIIALI